MKVVFQSFDMHDIDKAAEALQRCGIRVSIVDTRVDGFDEFNLMVEDQDYDRAGRVIEEAAELILHTESERRCPKCGGQVTAFEVDGAEGLLAHKCMELTCKECGHVSVEPAS